MTNIRRIRLERLRGRLEEVVYELSQLRITHFREGWRPSVNAYRCEDCIEVCVDLAGVDREAIELLVEPCFLTIRGRRNLPEPEGDEKKPLQILAMEIDHGPFERQVKLPAEVDPGGTTASQCNGLLWIHLPLRPHG